MKLIIQNPQIKEFTFSEFKRILVGNAVGYGWNTNVAIESAKEEFSRVLKENRFEVLGDFRPYSIIQDGYNQLKYVETYEGKRIPVKEILEKLKNKFDF